MLSRLFSNQNSLGTTCGHRVKKYNIPYNFKHFEECKDEEELIEPQMLYLPNSSRIIFMHRRLIRKFSIMNLEVFKRNPI